MDAGGGRGKQLVVRHEIYFRGHREHSPEYPGVYPDIPAGLLRSIMRNSAARGILAIRHRAWLSRLGVWLLPKRGGAGSTASLPASRAAATDSGEPGERPVQQHHGRSLASHF